MRTSVEFLQRQLQPLLGYTPPKPPQNIENTPLNVIDPPCLIPGWGYIAEQCNAPGLVRLKSNVVRSTFFDNIKLENLHNG